MCAGRRCSSPEGSPAASRAAQNRNAAGTSEAVQTAVDMPQKAVRKSKIGCSLKVSANHAASSVGGEPGGRSSGAASIRRDRPCLGQRIDSARGGADRMTSRHRSRKCRLRAKAAATMLMVGLVLVCCRDFSTRARCRYRATSAWGWARARTGRWEQEQHASIHHTEGSVDAADTQYGSRVRDRNKRSTVRQRSAS